MEKSTGLYQSKFPILIPKLTNSIIKKQNKYSHLPLNKERRFGYNIGNKKAEVTMMNGLLIRSIKENLILDMIYISASNQITQRKIIVKEIDSSKIRAYCFLRKQTRLFKIDNILSVMPVKQTYRKTS